MATVSAPVERRAPGRLFVDGEWIEARSGATFDSVHPATGEHLATVAEARAEDVAAAVTAAHRAFEDGAWVSMDAADRAVILWRMGDLIEARRDELARLEVLDNGKPIREAQIDIREAVDAFRYYAGWCTKLQGDTIPSEDRCSTTRCASPSVWSAPSSPGIFLC